MPDAPQVQMNPISVPRLDVGGGAIGGGNTVDTSSYLRNAPPPMNAMDWQQFRASQAATQNQWNQNKLFQQDQAARSEFAKMLPKYVDKQTGQFDATGALNEAIGNPATNYYAAGMAKSYFDAQLIQKNVYQAQLGINIAKMEQINKAIAPIVALGDQAQYKDVQKQIDGLVGLKVIDANDALPILTQMQGLKGPNLASAVRSIQLRTMSAEAQAKSVYGELFTIPSATGTTVGTFQQTPPGGGGPARFTPQTFVTNPPAERTIGPDEASQTGLEVGTKVPTVATPQGVPQVLPYGAPEPVQGRPLPPVQQQGAAPIPQPMEQSGAGQGSTFTKGQQPLQGTGSKSDRQQGLPGPSPRAQESTGSPSGSTAPAPFITSLSPFQSTLQGQQAQNIATYENDAGDRAATAQNALKDIGMIKGALTKIKTGGGAETYAQLGTLLQAAGIPQNVVDAASNGDRAAGQVVQKAALDLVGQELRQTFLGLGQQKLMEYTNLLKALPNLETDPRAMTTLLNFLETRSKMMVGEYQAYKRWTMPKARGGLGRDPRDFRVAWQKELADSGIATAAPHITRADGSDFPDVLTSAEKQSISDLYKQ